MPIDPLALKRLFQQAITMADRQERAAWLVRECGENADLLAKLQALLAARDDPDTFLDRLAPVKEERTGEFTPSDESLQSIPLPSSEEKPGHVVGRYKLLEKIGEGGMGSVWMAEQREPVKRLVAIKLIRAGMDTQSVLTRFEAERQALALMDHPNIAKVLDGGTTESRRPYFVMELVKGLPLTEYCDSRRLSVDARLQLFIQICSAVQHAHQKGIIHRDLKPSNVLVTENDGKPIPKVIDFGLAKALTASNLLTDRTLHTAFGTVVGTPLYMAPEQVGINALDTDTRSDVYALGVMLYELLTGTTPLEKRRFKEAAWEEVKRVIQEEEPIRPSMRLSTSDALPNLAANRHTEPAKLTSMVRGELDWIVMKALEKDRNRRYETANGFSRDIQRYLANEMVEARPPSAGYRFSKFVKRNKGSVLAASLIVLALLAGIAGTSWQAFRAENARQEEARQREIAEAAASAEKAAKLDADAKRQEAERNLAYAKKGNDILGSVFTGLDPQANYATVAELRNALRDNLTKAVKELQGSAIGDPLAVADMQNKLGASLMGLGEANLAIEVFNKAHATRKESLGVDHIDTLSSMNYLALCYLDAGKTDIALPMFEKLLKLQTAKVGADHPYTLTSMNNLALGYKAVGKMDKALPLFEDTLKLMTAKLGADHPETINAMNHLATSYKAVGKMDKALPLLEEAFKLRTAKLGADHPATLLSMNSLALCYLNAGKTDIALPMFEKLLKLQTAKLGADHPDTLISMNNLAMGYQAVGKIDKTLPLIEDTLKLQTSKLGTDHPNTLRIMNNLAQVYMQAAKFDKAIALHEKNFKLTTAKLGEDHPDTLISMNNLARAYMGVNKFDEAIALHEKSFKLTTAKFGEDHPDTLTSMNNLAVGYQIIGNLDRAIPLLEKTFKLRTAKLGADHPATLMAMNNLATGYQAVGKMDKAIPLLEKTFKLRTAKLRADHPDSITSMNNLAVGYQIIGKLDRAIPLLEETLKLMTAKFGVDHPNTLTSMNNLASAYLDAGQLDKALVYHEKTLRLRQAKMGAEHRDTVSNMAFVGSTLIQLKRWSEAENILRQTLAIREKQQPDAWNTFSIRSLLGHALLGQKKYSEAEPLLVQGYEGMKEREKSIPANSKKGLVHVLDLLIQFYTETSKPNEVKKWQSEKERRTQTLDKK